MGDSDTKRIRNELKRLGVGLIGLRTPESNSLSHIIHHDEHIGGVIYGRYDGGLAWLVATNQRILFIDKKPFFKLTEELSYDVVSGVKTTRAGFFSAVVLHTRVGDYSIRFVTTQAAQQFVRYLETKRLEKPILPEPIIEEYNEVMNYSTDMALKFLKEHDVAVLSTVDSKGSVHGAVVYYVVGMNDYIYILTKNSSSKARNITGHGQVALTVYEPGTEETVQLSGHAEFETDLKVANDIFKQIVKPRFYRGTSNLPPVTKIVEGDYVVIRIATKLVIYRDYSKAQEV